MVKTIGVDFDGVIHKYSEGWKDGEIYDIPTYGVVSALAKLIELGYEILIFSTRCNTEQGRKDIAQYMKKYGIPYSKIYDGKGKPLMILLIDDNVIRYEVNLDLTLNQTLRILSMQNDQ